MFSYEFMSYLMSNPLEETKKEKEKNVLKKGLVGVINYVTATSRDEGRVYSNT